MKKKKSLILLLCVLIVSTFAYLETVPKNQVENKPDIIEKKIVMKKESENSNEVIGSIHMCKGKILLNSIEKDCGSLINYGLYETDILETKSKSFMKLKMKDKTRMTVGQNSVVILSEYKVRNKNDKNISVNLVRGFLHTNFREKVKKGSAFVKTKSAVMGIRGTEFITESFDNKTEVYLLHGLVHVEPKNKGVKSFMLNSKERFILED